MKKLMIAAAIVCAAVVANAASVNWKSGTIFRAVDAAGTTGDTAAAKSKTTVTAYLYLFDTEKAYTDAQKKTAQQLATDYYYNSKVTADATKQATTGSLANITTDATTGTTYYGLVIYADTTNSNIPDGKDAFVKCAFGSATYGGGADVTVGNMCSGVSTWTAVVPEPTSGLLLLLGVAGLALKRRRA